MKKLTQNRFPHPGDISVYYDVFLKSNSIRLIVGMFKYDQHPWRVVMLIDGMVVVNDFYKTELERMTILDD